jgi:hypothetical protein
MMPPIREHELLNRAGIDDDRFFSEINLGCENGK